MKVGAWVLMFMQHGVIAFGGEVGSLLMVGSGIVYPAFAYSAGIGARRSRDLAGYVLRLAAMGIAAEVPFRLILGGSMNVGFFLALGIFSVWLDMRLRFVGLVVPLVLWWLGCGVAHIGCVLLVLCVWWGRDVGSAVVIMIGVVLSSVHLQFVGWIICGAFMMVVPFINVGGIRWVRSRLMYVVYPGHLWLLLGVAGL